MPRKKKPQRRSNGEGSIYQRKDGRFEAKVTTYNPVTGKSKRKSIIDQIRMSFIKNTLTFKIKS